MIKKLLCLLWKHKWIFVYKEPGACIKTGYCSRCGVDYRWEIEEHESWGDVEYLSENSCQKGQYCNRCGKLRKVGHDGNHDYSEWEFYLPKSCEHRRICNHCGNIQYSDVNMSHNWHEGRCKRCGKEEPSPYKPPEGCSVCDGKGGDCTGQYSVCQCCGR